MVVSKGVLALQREFSLWVNNKITKSQNYNIEENKYKTLKRICNNTEGMGLTLIKGEMEQTILRASRN